MKYVAAVLLLGVAGNNSPSQKDVKSLLEKIGCDDIDTEKIDSLLSNLEGKDIAELIKEGQEKMVNMPSGTLILLSCGAPCRLPLLDEEAILSIPFHLPSCLTYTSLLWFL